ncbi:MAG: DUF2279 domain-containing protein [Bacteriovoracaceae bacterium]
MRNRLCLLVLLFSLNSYSQTQEEAKVEQNPPVNPASASKPRWETQIETWNLTPNQKKNYTYAGMAIFPSAMFVYGVTSWGWISDGISFRMRDEKMFQRDTYAGGADKVSHMYSLFMAEHAYYSYFLRLGWSPTEANKLAMAGAAATGLFIEIGDGISNYGFSVDDLLVDFIGVAFAGLLNAYPDLDSKIGFQCQYWNTTPNTAHPNRKIPNPIDDYNNQKYVINIKAAGFEPLAEHWATKFVNLDVGYYSRGYKGDPGNPNKDPEKFTRNMFLGLSLNLSEIFDGKSKVASTIFKYYQTPYNAVQVKKFPL